MTKQNRSWLFVGLLNNAIKYFLAESVVNLDLYKRENHSIISVKDKGVGISAKDLPHIFERLYRVDAYRTKSDNVGRGLVLSIAKQIIEQH